MLIGEKLWEYLESKGVKRHEHTNGLVSCSKCSIIVATGKSQKELDEEWEKALEDIKKDIT